MKILLFLMLMLSSISFSQGAEEKVLGELSLSSEKFYFAAIEDGVAGKLKAGLGLIPAAVFKVDKAYQFPFLRVSDGGGVYKFEVIKKTDSFDETVATFTRAYDLKKRVEKVKKERKHADENPIIDENVSQITSRSFMIAIVSNEIYKITIYEADDLESLKKLPITKLSPFFNWGVYEL